MESNFKVAIAGAGVAGLTAAVALHRLGIEVAVYEKHQGSQQHTTGFTLWSYSADRLAEFGLSPDRLDEVGCAVEMTEVRNQRGRVILPMPVGEVSRKLGADSYEIRRPDLLQALEGELPSGSVRRGQAVRTADVEGKKAWMELEGGDRVEADLVIGADGIHSALREVVAGPTELRDSGYRGCSALAPRPEKSMPAQTHIDIWGKGGKAGAGDVGRGECRWYLTWKKKEDEDRQTRAQLLEAYRDWDPLMPELIQATPESEIVHHAMFDIAPIETWRKNRIVLVGDAAHATTPFAAMGANMAIEDIAVLVAELQGRDSTEEALEAYEESRKKRAEDVVQKGRRMSRLTQLHSPFAAWVRDQLFTHMSEKDAERVTREMASGD